MISQIVKQEILSSLGFHELNYVRSLISIAHLFPSRNKRCGIYCLAFESGQCYIGQTVDIVKRFSQHRKNYQDIAAISFIPFPKSELDKVERETIYKAENSGLLLRNVMHVSSVVGETDLDEVMPESEQNQWLESVPKVGVVESAKIIFSDAHLTRADNGFKKFLRHPLRKTAREALKRYLTICIPAPRDTEYSFWSVSCMPSTNKNTWPRLFSVNAASMELFVSGWNKHDGSFWSFIVVDRQVLLEHWHDEERLICAFPFIEIFKRNYRDAGQNQVTITAGGEDGMRLLLSDDGICRAAATLCLRVMKKRPNLYAKYHCAQLVNLALSEFL